MEELEELKKELEEVLEKVNKKLEDEEKYYTIDHDGEIIYDTDDSYDVDIFNKKIGNYFKTEKEAEEYLEDLKVKTEIKKIAKELNGDDKIDWKDVNKAKYYLRYSHRATNIVCNYENSYQAEGVTYCLDGDFRRVCIERIGEERLKKYLKRN